MLTRPFIVTGFVQSGMVTIPAGSRCWGVSVISGAAYVNGFACAAGYSMSVSLPDSKDLLGTPIVVSGTWNTGATNVFWVQ